MSEYTREIKCTNCIHCETAYYREDKMCVPQQFSSSDPRSINDGRVCKCYEEAPKFRERFGLYGLSIHETWNEEEGHYTEDREFLI